MKRKGVRNKAEITTRIINSMMIMEKEIKI